MSGNELTVYARMTDPLAFVREFGTEIALSKMFGCANEAQGKVLAMACMCEGENPIALSRKYHIIQNNLSMKADAMLAELRARGGKHKIVERTSEKASVEITYDGQTYVETITWEDAQAEPYVRSKDGSLKDNWATPRARRQMLWARAISEAVRTLAPEIVAGTYTPEETHDFADEQTTTATKVVDVVQLMETTAAKAEAVADVVDVEPVVAEPKCSAEQRKQIKSLFDVIGASDEVIERALAKRNVKAMRYLTVTQANELIDSLTSRAQKAAAETVGDSRLPDETRTSDVTAPAGSVLVDEIKALLKEDLPLMKRIKEHLVANGKQKVSDLSHEEALHLKSCLEQDTVEAFFERSLVPFDVEEPQASG
jgi:hypothetical protein